MGAADMIDVNYFSMDFVNDLHSGATASSDYFADEGHESDCISLLVTRKYGGWPGKLVKNYRSEKLRSYMYRGLRSTSLG